MKQEIIRIDLNGVNCYLFRTDEGYVLIDTGGHLIMDREYSDRRDELIRRLEEEGLRPGNLKAIILTHGDSDHTSNAAYLREKYKTIIAMHKDDVNLVYNVTLEKAMETFQYNSIIYKIVFHFIKKRITGYTAKTLKEFAQFKPDVLLKNGDSLMSYGIQAEVIHLPGHTPGSIGILCENGEIIAGDTMANIKKPIQAPNATDFKLLKESINRIKQLKLTTVYPGHGNPFQASDIA